MKKFNDKQYLKVSVWNHDNVDTDIIIPSDYLKVVDKKGLGDYLFDSFRFSDTGKLGMKPEDRIKNPDFFLNKKGYENAEVLIAGDNFGCGSSREHAPWALTDYGFVAVISTSFAGIFYENSFKNGLLLIKLPQEQVEELMQHYTEETTSKEKIFIDLDDQQITAGDKQYRFEINPEKKKSLLLGIDEIGLILQENSDDIKEFEKKQKEEYPFLI